MKILCKILIPKVQNIPYVPEIPMSLLLCMDDERA